MALCVLPKKSIPNYPTLQVFLLFSVAELIKIHLTFFGPVQSTDILPTALHLYQDVCFVCASHAVLLSWCLKFLFPFRIPLCQHAGKQNCSALNLMLILEKPTFPRRGSCSRVRRPPSSVLPHIILHFPFLPIVYVPSPPRTSPPENKFADDRHLQQGESPWPTGIWDR